jgi:hypothetical protein
MEVRQQTPPVSGEAVAVAAEVCGTGNTKKGKPGFTGATIMFKFPARSGDPSDDAGLRTYVGGGGPETSGFADAPVPVELLDALRRHAAEVIACCLDAEADAYVRSHAHECDAQGHALTVRNGLQPVRLLATGIGPVEVRIPKMRSRASAIRSYRSTLVTRYKRKAGDMQPWAPASYLRAWVGGHWQRMVTELLGLPLGSTLHLPVARLDANWRRDAPAQVVRTCIEGTPLAIEAHSIAIPACNGVPAGTTLLAVVAERETGHWHLLACEEVEPRRQPAFDRLVSRLREGGLRLRAPLLAGGTDPNTKIDAKTTVRSTSDRKYVESRTASERDKRKCADSV